MDKKAAVNLLILSVKREEMQRDARKTGWSVSWLLREFWEKEKSEIRRYDINSLEVITIKVGSPWREARRYREIEARVIPKGMEIFQVYISESTFKEMEIECERLSLVIWELLLWIWERSRDSIRKYSAGDA